MRRAPCGQAERAEGGTSGTLVTEILGAPQRETVKEKLVKCVLAPRRPLCPRRGNQLPSLCGTPPRPSEGHRKHAGTISRLPPYSNFARTCKVATKAFFLFGPCTAQPLAALPLTDAAYPLRVRPVSLLAGPKGAPAALRAVGRGGARERAQFSHWGPATPRVVGRAGAAK